ncbi:Protein sprT [Xenorhabdus bovienii str. puntauvense]|uniref:Protein SprT n=2 Tax=Xenorhabdus bovienii TaxID=40576 RepID=A0A077NLW0_XENBV|nr:Protein sprT [Xenorhabdus bovienii str. feltiae France]CDG92787.1 Protein sprT [Xenorhabdus bovienii str. feltiae Florida]CDG98740.1 Protein sprT [Xenorhabdus bovienii str. puntauvense]
MSEITIPYTAVMKLVRVPLALQQAVMRTLRQKLAQASDYLETTFPEPCVTYRQRGTIAGSARLQGWEIRLNPVLLIENQQSFIDEVIPHELAHLLTYHQFGKVAPHGKEWRFVMETVLKVSACRTHQFSVDSVRSKIFIYYCRCQQHELTIRQHNKVLRGKSCYLCQQCKERLKLLEQDKSNTPQSENFA